MRIALTFAGLAVTMVAATAGGERSRGLSLEQIRGVMRAHAAAFNACLTAATRQNKPFYGPFVYQIQVDRQGKVTSARPYQPSSIGEARSRGVGTPTASPAGRGSSPVGSPASFDRCITGVLKRARFPGGPASVEAPIVFDPR
jgi:hypothetical protein